MEIPINYVRIGCYPIIPTKQGQVRSINSEEVIENGLLTEDGEFYLITEDGFFLQQEV